MKPIGMSDAAKLAKMSADGLRRALQADPAMKDHLVMINPRACTVDADALTAWITKRDEEGRKPGAGRPRGAKNKKVEQNP